VAGERVGIREILADRAVRSIVGLALLVMAGFGLVLPVLPLYARSFGVDYGAASLMLSAYAFTRLGSDLVAGPLVDRFGERRTGSAALCLTAGCALAAGLAPSFAVAVVCWSAGGAGSAVMFAAFYSYLLKAVPKERMARTLSLFYGAFNVGMIGGGPLGGLIAHRLDLGAPLVVYSGVLVVGAFVYMRFVPEPPNAREEPPLTPEEAERERDLPIARQGKTAIGRLLRTPGFRTVMLLNLAYMWMVAAVFDTLVPFFAKDELGVSTVGIGVLFAIVLVAELTVLYPAGSAADRLGRKAVLVPALAGLAVTTVALGFTPGVVLFAVVLAGLGIASGYAGVPPAAMLSDVTPAGASGTAIGAFRFCGDLGFLIGPAVAGYSTKALGFEEAFAIAAIPTLIALVAVARTPETLRRLPAGQPAS